MTKKIKDKNMIFKIVFSITFAGISIFIMLSDWAKENINSMNIILLLIAFLPWIIKYIKSLEINGIGKLELITDKEKKEIMDELPILEDNIEEKEKKLKEEIPNYEKYKNKYEDKIPFGSLSKEFYAKEAAEELWWNLLKIIAKIKNKYIPNIEVENYFMSISELEEHKIISNSESSLLNIIMRIFERTKSYNGNYDFDYENVIWAMKVGTALYDSLKITYEHGDIILEPKKKNKF